MSDNTNTALASLTGMLLTKAGIRMQAQAQVGGQLIITKIVIGGGILADGQAVEELTDLINPLMNLGIQDIAIVGDGTTRLRALLLNTYLSAGFPMREIAVFAKIGDAGQEQLYSYINVGDKYTWVYTPEELAIEDIVEVYVIIGNAQNVTATINDRVTLATKLDVTDAINEHNKDISAHPALMRGVQQFTEDGIFIVPEEVTKIYVTATGGGGGGGGAGFSTGTGGTTRSSGAGGGGGAATWVYRKKIAVTAGQEINITIGKGGTGGSSGSSAGASGFSGTAGGTTSIGTLLSLPGGNSGGGGLPDTILGSASDGGGGAAAISALEVETGSGGSDGGSGWPSANGGDGGNNGIFAGAGGGSRGSHGTGINGRSAAGYGNGGGGAGNTLITGFKGGVGGNGSDGIAIIEW